MQNIKTVADVKNVPAGEWIIGHSVGGKCPYCGKTLPVYRDCSIHYGPCDCEIATAIKKHNDKVIELRK